MEIKLKTEINGWVIEYNERNSYQFKATKGEDVIESETLKEIEQIIKTYSKKKIDGICNDEKVIVHFVDGENQIWVTEKDTKRRSREYIHNIYLDNEDNNKILELIKKVKKIEADLEEGRRRIERDARKKIDDINTRINALNTYEKVSELQNKMIPINYKEKVIESL